MNEPKTINDLLNLLAEKGGAIVSSANCNRVEIAFARYENRMFVDENGYGYIWRPEPEEREGKK